MLDRRRTELLVLAILQKFLRSAVVRSFCLNVSDAGRALAPGIAFAVLMRKLSFAL